MGRPLVQRTANIGRTLNLTGGDPDFASNSLLLPLNGPDASTAISDVSEDGRAITVAGNAQIDTDQSKWNGSSLLLDGSGDYLTTANDATLLDLSDDLSIQFWARPSSLSSTRTLISTRDESQSNEGFWLTITSTGALSLTGFSDNGVSEVASVTGTISAVAINVWSYVQLIKTGTTWRGYVNAVQNFSVTESGEVGQGSSQLSIGRMERAAGNLEYVGHLADLRITNQLARATTVPLAAHPTS